MNDRHYDPFGPGMARLPAPEPPKRRHRRPARWLARWLAGVLLAGLLLIRQPYALLLAAIIAFIDALPVFGTGTVLLPWAVLCCLVGSFPKGIALTALYLVIWLVRSIMEPKLMASSAGLPPLPALLAMYVGFCAMGVAGMILGPILLLLVKQLHDGGYLHLWK